MHITKFIIWIIISWIIVSTISYFILKKCKHLATYFLCILFDIAAAIGSACLAIVYDSYLSWHANYLLIALYISFFSYSFANIVIVISRVLKKSNLKHWNTQKAKLLSSIVFTVLISVFGIINMQNVVANKNVYTSNKLSKDHTFIVMSDLHFGSAQSVETVQKTLDKISKENPEFIVLAGDITDEFTSKEQMYMLYEMIGDLNIPTYYVYGNHDRQESASKANGVTYTQTDLEQTLEQNGIIILKDSIVNIDDDISLLGREVLGNSSRLDVTKLSKRDSNRYQITVEHYPYGIDDILSTKADLQISGHSHAGQFFPLEEIYQLAGCDSYGEYTYKNTKLLVSSGAGGWIVPFRTSRHCQFEVIYLQKE